MDNYSNIYDYLSCVDKIDDDTYNLLVNKFGKKDVNNILSVLLRERLEEEDIYNKLIGNGNKNCDIIVNQILSKRIHELIGRIEELVNKSGLCVDDYKFLFDKVELVKNNCNNEKIVGYIRELYDEFIILRNRICEYNLDIINNIISRDDKNYDELYQEGVLALLHAIETYDPNKGDFYKHAYYVIKYKVPDHKYDYEFATNVPLSYIRNYHSLLRIIKYYKDRCNRILTMEEIAKKMNKSVRSISVYSSFSSDIGISLYDTKNVDDEYIQLVDTIGGNDDIRELENVVIGNTLCDNLYDLLGELSERQRLCLYYHYFKGYSFTDIANFMGITPQGSSDIHRRIIKKLRKHKSDIVR